MSLSRQDACYLLIVLALGAGCSGSGTPSGESSADQGITSSVPSAKATSAPTAKSSETPSAVSAVQVPPVDPGKLQAAKDAYQTLIAPGSDPMIWETAQQKLIELGPDAAPVLLEGVRSANPLEREMAATVCALTGSPTAELQTALVACLQDDVLFVRANAAAALANIPEHQDRAIAALSDLLSASDPQLRRMAAANLGSFGQEASEQLPKLTAVLSDHDAEVVTPVIQLLGRLGPSALEAVPQLQKIAFEEEGEVKQAAEQALLQIQAPAEKAE